MPVPFIPPQANPMTQSTQASSTGGLLSFHPNTIISFVPPLANLMTQPTQASPLPSPAAITPTMFQTNYPVWSALILTIFDTSTTVAFQDGKIAMMMTTKKQRKVEGCKMSGTTS
jgi:hypothetical protein